MSDPAWHVPLARRRSRRDFFLQSGGALALRGGAGLLAGCSKSTSVGTSAAGASGPTGPGGLPLPRPDQPVTLPRWEDPIASGQAPETGGEFTVYNYPDYI